MKPTSGRASDFAERTVASSFDAAATIAARTTGALTLRRGSAAEAVRMVEEKVEAVCEGAMGAGLMWGAFLFASALRGGATPADVSHAFFDMAEAAAEPAWRRVGANARRLTRAY